ncbi:hypothetical protein G6L37_01600 [Agrobacterium rubi]|nr:hypothetical protein [Agrobacterium rubi]NTF24088.1 hypothetical protein [Agrobacterium rubi]
MPTPNYGIPFVTATLKRSARVEEGRVEMEFNTINGRQFVLRKEDDGSFFAFEMIPNGRLAHELPDGSYRYEDWPGHAAAKDNPNGYVAAVEADGIDADAIILCGAGYGVYTRYLSSINEAAAEFARCVREDRRYDDQDRAKMADPEYNASIKASEEQMSRDYRAFNDALHQASVENEPEMFKGLHGMMGPLSKGAKERILSFFNSPSTETWDDCARLMVKGGKTMWQLWGDVDPASPRSLPGDVWPCIPDVDMMKDALRALGTATPEEWKATSRRF